MIPVTIIPLFPIKVLRIACDKFSYDGGDTLLAAFEEEMEYFPSLTFLAEPLKEQGFILVFFEDG